MTIIKQVPPFILCVDTRWSNFASGSFGTILFCLFSFRASPMFFLFICLLSARASFLQILIGLTHFASASVSVRYVCCDNWAQSEIIHGALRHDRAALFALCFSDRTSPHVPLRTCLYLTMCTALILSVALACP